MNLKAKTLLLTFFLLASNFLVAQINFAEISLRAALQRANISDQKVFVDSYAEWCQPCKEFDLIFTKRDLAKYFNKNFINVKVNMDEEFGDDFRRRYGIAFLPTILFLDKDGKVIFKVDKLIDDIELMNLAIMAQEGQKPVTTPPPPPFVKKETISKPAEVKRVESDLVIQDEQPKEVVQITEESIEEPEIIPETVTTPISTTPVSEPEVIPKKETETKEANPENNIAQKEIPKGPEMGPATVKAEKENIVTQENEKVLYVLDANSGTIPPEILYEEAYFKMQFNDGSHLIAAKKYLNTQDVWSTEKNMKFIYDFLYNTDTPEFDFFVLNRETYEKMIGKEAIDRTMDILVSNKLYSGYPRPNFQQSVKLFRLLDSELGEENAYQYYLNRLYQKDKKEEYVEIAEKYLNEFRGEDQTIISSYLAYRLQEKASKKELKELEQLIKRIKVRKGYNYNLSRARLSYYKGSKKEAQESAQQAIVQAKKDQIDYSEANELLEMIKEL